MLSPYKVSYSVLTVQTEKDSSKRRHAPSPPDSLCHPGAPDGEIGDRGSLHHHQKAGRSRIKLGR